MKISYNIYKDDLVAFNIYFNHNSKVRKFNNYLTYLILLFTLSAYFYFDNDSSLPFKEKIVLIAPDLAIYIGIVTIFFILFLKFFSRATLKAMINKNANSNLLGDKTLEILEEGVVLVNENSELKVKWQGIEKIVEIKEYYFILLAELSSITIPKRCFKDSEELKPFMALLKDKLEENKLT